MGKTIDFVEAQREELLKRAQNLAISFADKNAARFMKTIEAQLDEKDGNYYWDREDALEAFKQILATAYALGFIDSSEKKELVKLHV